MNPSEKVLRNELGIDDSRDIKFNELDNRDGFGIAIVGEVTDQNFVYDEASRELVEIEDEGFDIENVYEVEFNSDNGDIIETRQVQ